MADAAEGAALGHLIGQLQDELDLAIHRAREWQDHARQLESENDLLRKKLEKIGQSHPVLVAELDRLTKRDRIADEALAQVRVDLQQVNKQTKELMSVGGRLWHRMRCLEEALQMTSAELSVATVLITEFGSLIDKHSLAAQLPADMEKKIKVAREDFLASGTLCWTENADAVMKDAEIGPSPYLAMFANAK